MGNYLQQRKFHLGRSRPYWRSRDYYRRWRKRGPGRCKPGRAAVVAWHQRKNDIPAIGSNRFDPDTGMWLTPVSLTTGTAPVDRTAVAIDADGNAFAAWLDYGGDGPKNGWKSRYDAGTDTWGPAELFETSDTTDVEELAIEANASEMPSWYGKPASQA